VKAHTLSLVLVVAPTLAHADAPPNVVNARLETRSGAAGIVAAVRAAGAGPAWVAWSAPLDGTHQMCCWNDVKSIGRGTACPGCRLESHGDSAFTFNSTRGGTTRLDGDDRFVVLARVAGGRVDRIRQLSWSCGIDVGGKPLVWLDGVTPAESLRFLAAQVGDGDEDGMQMALAAIAMHADAGADALLEGFTRPARPEELRKQAAFWLGNARGRKGYEVVSRLIRDDPSDEVRAHAAFALSQNDQPEAVDAIIQAARRDPSGHVRGQALFWLAQKAGDRAADAITRAIADDPETDVKEKAVFALSQLPKDEGVPRLIKLARTHSNPAVRKKAMFWLGQSEDPRALAFFEEVLKR
jgi:hypothetical protein